MYLPQASIITAYVHTPYFGLKVLHVFGKPKYLLVAAAVEGQVGGTGFLKLLDCSILLLPYFAAGNPQQSDRGKRNEKLWQEPDMGGFED